MGRALTCEASIGPACGMLRVCSCPRPSLGLRAPAFVFEIALRMHSCTCEGRMQTYRLGR